MLVIIAVVEEYGHQVDVGTLQHHGVHSGSQVFGVVDWAEKHDLENERLTRHQTEPRQDGLICRILTCWEYLTFSQTGAVVTFTVIKADGRKECPP